MDESRANISSIDEMRETNMVVDCGPFRNCTEISNTPGANVVIPIVTSVTGIIGNVIAIIVLQSSTKREQARTVFYVLVASLAWTDLLGIIFTTWPVIVVYAHGTWPGGTGLCNYHAFAMISFALITPCIVCTMAVERYVGIRHGYFYQSHVNRPKARLAIVVQWIMVLLAASFPLFGFGRYSKQYPGTWCFLDMHPETIWDSIYACTVAIVNLALILMIIGCNIIVTGSLLHMRYKRTHENSPANDKHRFTSRKQREIEIQMVVLLLGITVVFTICWAPLMFQILLNQFSGNDVDRRTDILTVRLASVNQVLDPWVYILFRKAFFQRCWNLRRKCRWNRTNCTSPYSSHREIKVPAIYVPVRSPLHQVTEIQINRAPSIPKDDSGTGSADGDLSTFADSVILHPSCDGLDSNKMVDPKSRSWCCQYDPEPTNKPKKKLRTQSARTQNDSNDNNLLLLSTSPLADSSPSSNFI